MNKPAAISDFTFSTDWRVRFNEVDLQGVVHHSEIIKYFEIARIEYWRCLGLSYAEFRKAGYEFVVARIDCDFIKPLHFDETIRVYVRTSAVSRTSISLNYLILDEGREPAVCGNTLMVCVRVGIGKPFKLPDSYLETVRTYEKAGTVEIKSSRDVR